MVFDDSATRATAIGTANFSEGMVTYTKDDDAIQVYDGSDFVGVGSDAGLIHINTQTFSAVSSVNVDNVFTSDYKNYRIVLRATNSAASITSRFRASGTPESGNVYVRNYLIGESTSVEAANTTATTFGFTQSATFFLTNIYAVADIYGPQLSENTFSLSTFRSEAPSLGLAATRVNTSTAYDGIEFNVGSGTTTGSFSIFGYKD
jgi:hypothetical protein